MSTGGRREVARRLAAAWSRLRPAHLSDRELARLLAADGGGDPAAAGAAHLAACARCAARFRSLRAGLDRIGAAAEAAFDDAVPAWRLARQRRRILRRIQRAAGRRGAARILRFPAAAAPAAGGAPATRRRLSLAAAAGLLLALLAGQALDDRQPSPSRPPAAVEPPRTGSDPPAGPPQTAADEQFMRELEEALTTSRVTPLVALDEMTPRVRAAAIDIR